MQHSVPKSCGHLISFNERTKKKKKKLHDFPSKYLVKFGK